MPTTRRTFEGREVVNTEVVVTGVTAMSDDHDPYHVGDVVYLVCEVVIDRVIHRPVKDADRLTRVEHGQCVVGAVVEATLVQEAIELAKLNAEAAKGIQQLGLDGPGV